MGVEISADFKPLETLSLLRNASTLRTNHLGWAGWGTSANPDLGDEDKRIVGFRQLGPHIASSRIA